MIRFGPAGRDDKFYEDGFKESDQIPEYLSKLGLNAFEYQCVRGVNINNIIGEKLKKEAKKYDIALSVHAPYYISMSGLDDEKRLKSIVYIKDSIKAALLIGADRITIHTGSLSSQTREQALVKAKDTFSRAIDELKNEGLYGKVYLCPETMGKINQLGTLEEVLELCRLDDLIVPCIDFGHLNARTGGGLKTKKDFDIIYNTLKNNLGKDKLKLIHAHFSYIEYTVGGEKQHLTFDNNQGYGPDYRLMIDMLSEKNVDARIICESRGTQAKDAVEMRNYYIQK